MSLARLVDRCPHELLKAVVVLIATLLHVEIEENDDPAQVDQRRALGCGLVRLQLQVVEEVRVFGELKLLCDDAVEAERYGELGAVCMRFKAQALMLLTFSKYVKQRRWKNVHTCCLLADLERCWGWWQKRTC